MAKLQILLLVVFMAKGLTARRCYVCGYQQTNDGDKTELPNQEAPFCGDFATAQNVKDCANPDDCCASLKEYTLKEQEGTNNTVVMGRHGCQQEMDAHLGQFELECKKDGENCERYEDDKLPSHGGHEGEVLFRAEICICDRDECNKGDPIIPEPTAEPTAESTIDPNGRTCFTCGYEQIDGGEKTELPDHEVPLCGDWAQADTVTACHNPDDCCAALKEYTFQIRDEKNVSVVVGRHGCQEEMHAHLGQFELECKKGGEANCERYENDKLPPHDGHEGETIFRAEICICDSNRCNAGDPIIPEPTSAPDGASEHLAQLGLVAAALFLALRQY